MSSCKSLRLTKCFSLVKAKYLFIFSGCISVLEIEWKMLVCYIMEANLQ